MHTPVYLIISNYKMSYTHTCQLITLKLANHPARLQITLHDFKSRLMVVSREAKKKQ